MLNIVIKNNNQFFNLGFHFILQSIFPEYSLSTQCAASLNERIVQDADVVVLDLCRGAEFVCHPELLNRKPGLLIGLVARQNQRGRGALPLCLEEIVFVGRDEKISQVMAKIKLSWILVPPAAEQKSVLRCERCRQRRLSPQQRIIAAAIYQGLTVNAIARELSLCNKTVFAHKRLIMSKFHLRNDLDLLLFLRYMNSAKGHS
ncbi:helix-turn-helix transcriptional regulator [Klebsiella pasteurii]|uniref:HTH luxR-type domain-containing protein n=1 Tax=Klebsiella pasteurii TaxID=2587529 RepID=A0A9Q9SAZ7_9ENTR|nr:LuxR C-terminal-related transcriptional regulator [Klebsiella pasteurii]VUS95552.1 hypothetical protein SB6410_04300 [Klebsiella pasteurii]VUT01214.1 hypothetical protein SB6409_01750 [Klebsiella pasteurii]